MTNENQKPQAVERRKHRWYFYPGIVLLVIAILFGGFVGFLTVTEYCPEPVEPALSGGSAAEMPDGEPMEILTFNLGYASLGTDASFLMDGGTGSGQSDEKTIRKNMEGIAGILEEADADLYMLQEIDRDCARTFGINQLEEFGALLEGSDWAYAPNFLCKYVAFPFSDPFGEMDSGVATYSKFNLESPERISLPNPFSWPVRTMNLKRCMLSTRIPLADSDRELVILNFHLEAYDSGEGKQAQTEAVLHVMQQEYEKGNYVIAGGDFNQIFPEVQTVVKPTSEWVPGDLDPLPESFDGWRYVYDDTNPSCRLLNQPYDPADPLTQYYVIDGFIVSPNVEVNEVETLDEEFRFSDHNPVRMEFTLR